jgi:hypothetical protein
LPALYESLYILFFVHTGESVFTRCSKKAKDFLEAQPGGKLKIDKMVKEDKEWDETDAAKRMNAMKGQMQGLWR